MSDIDTIHNAMLGAIDNRYQKTVGFPTYDLTRAAALSIASLTDDLSAAQKLLNVDNLTGDSLTRFVKQHKGIIRKVATYATVTLTVTGNGTVNVGDLFESGGGIQFAATVSVTISGSGSVTVQAVKAGACGNVAAQSITAMPITLAGIVSVTNFAPAIGGYDQEDDDSLRERYYEALKRPATSGNKFHYMAWAKDISGVGDAKAFPLAQGANTVDVVIIDADKKPAGASLITQVQEYIDPASAGRGEGQAPIGAHCYVSTAEGLSINVSVTVVLLSGYDLATVKAKIETAMTDYLKFIAFTQNYVSAGKLANAVNDTEGVKDYSNLLVNSGTGNVSVGERQVAVLGEVVVNVAS